MAKLNSTVDMVKCNKYKVLPTVYDNSLSYYEVLCKLTEYIDNLEERVTILEEEIEQLKAQ